MQKKTKVSQSPSVLSIIAKAFRPRQTWDDKVGNAFIRNCERRKSIFWSGSVYGRYSLDSSAVGINSWLCMGSYSATRHRGITTVSANLLLAPK